MPMQSYTSPQYKSSLLPDWLNPNNNVQSIAPVAAPGVASDYVSAMPWGKGSMPVSPFTGTPDYAASLASTPAIGEALNSVGTGTGGGSSMWGGFGDWMDNSGILGKKLADGTSIQGWGGLALGAGSGLMNAYTAMQQLNLGKETLANNKAQYAQNFAAQQKTTNAALSDRQAARVASNPSAYQSVGEYMKKNGI